MTSNQLLEQLKGYKDTVSGIDVDAGGHAEKFEKPRSEHIVSEDDDWLFDSSRNPVAQADILREYKP